jgi:hypothetical protein
MVTGWGGAVFVVGFLTLLSSKASSENISLKCTEWHPESRIIETIFFDIRDEEYFINREKADGKVTVTSSRITLEQSLLAAQVIFDIDRNTGVSNRYRKTGDGTKLLGHWIGSCEKAESPTIKF